MDKDKRIVIDYHLKLCAHINANLGIDSTKEDVALAKEDIRREYLIIKSIDEEFYKTITPYNEI